MTTSETSAPRPIGSRIGKYIITADRGVSLLGRHYEAAAADGSAVTVVALSARLSVAGDQAEPEVAREFKAAARVRNVRVAAFLFAGRDGGEIYAVHEGAGRTADDLLAAGPANPRSACLWAMQAARGLQAVHDAGLVHGGVRPDCLQFDDAGVVRLGGLGLTRALELLQETRIGVPVAEPLYVAPEIYRDSAGDGRADVYSLGAVLFHLLAGRPPFVAATSMQVLHGHVGLPVPDPRAARADVPAAAAAVVKRAMAKAPAERYQSAAAMADALAAAAEEIPEAPPPPLPATVTRTPGLSSRREPPRPPARTGPAPAVLIAGALALAAAVGGLWFAIRPARPGPVSGPEPAKPKAVPTEPDRTGHTIEPVEVVQPTNVAPPPVASQPEEPPYAIEFRILIERADKAAMGPQAEAAAAELRAFAARHVDGDARRREFAAQASAAAAALTRPPPPVEVPSDTRPVAVFGDLSTPANAVAFSADGSMVAVGGGVLADGDKGELAVRKVADGKLLFARGAHEGPVTSVAFSADGEMLLSAGGKTARLYNAKTGEQLASFMCRFKAHAAAISPDGLTIAVADGPFIQLYNVRGKSPRGDRLEGHTEWLNALVFSPDSKWLASAGADNTIRIWNVADRTTKVVTGHTSWIHGLAISADGSLLASASRDQTVRLWKMPDGAPVKTLAGHEDRAWGVCFSPDGKRVASAGSFDRTLRVWDIEAGTSVVWPRAHDGKVSSVAWSPDGTTLASCGDDKRVKLWKAPK